MNRQQTGAESKSENIPLANVTMPAMVLRRGEMKEPQFFLRSCAYRRHVVGWLVGIVMVLISRIVVFVRKDLSVLRWGGHLDRSVCCVFESRFSIS